MLLFSRLDEFHDTFTMNQFKCNLNAALIYFPVCIVKILLTELSNFSHAFLILYLFC